MSAFDFVTAADTTNMKAGGSSFWGGVSDGLTKGVGAAVVSGAYSIWNTGVDVSNAIFGTQAERADVADTLSRIDQDWGTYYNDNKSAIDVAGFVAGSFLPGTLAVKGLKAVQAGGSYGTFGRVLGYTSKMENAYLNKALTELATEGGTVFTRINQSKMASMAWGTADAVLQTAAFETAAALTMKSSPVLEGKDFSDISWDIAKTSLFGGLLGGGINALSTNRIFKQAGSALEQKVREFDRLVNPGAVDVSFGDRTFGIVDAVLNLPKEVLDPAVKLTHGRTGIMDSLPVELTKKLLDKTLKKTVERGVQNLEGALTHVVEADMTVGKPFAAALVNVAKQGLESGQSDESIRRALGGVLLRLHSVEAIGTRPWNLSGEIRYLDPKGDVTKLGSKVFSAEPRMVPMSVEETVAAKLIGPGMKIADEQPMFRVVGDEAEASMGTIGREAPSAKELYALGFDFAVDPLNKTVSVSPLSTIYERIVPGQQDMVPMFFNAKTMQSSFTTVPTVADIATLKKPLVVNTSGVVAGNRTFTFSASNFTTPVDSVEATARHIFAQELKTVSGTVDSRDIAFMDTLLHEPNKAAPGLKIFDAEKKAIYDFAELSPGQFNVMVFNNKYDETIRLLEKFGDGADMRDIAYRMNVTTDWLERAVGTQFSRRELWQSTDGWQIYHKAGEKSRFWERENLVLRYNTGKLEEMNSFSTDAMVAWQTRVKMATQKAQSAAAVVLGQVNYQNLLPMDADLAKFASSQEVGPSLLGASNADYTDRLRTWAQYTGMQVNQMAQKRVDSALRDLQSTAAKILKSPDAASELSAIVTKLRLSGDGFALHVDALSGKRALVDYASFKKVESGGEVAFKSYTPLTDDVADFVTSYQAQHADRVEATKVLAAAQGTPLDWKSDMLYMPPVDTQRVPYFAFVRKGDGTMFGSSEVSMITARSEGELQSLVAQIEKNPQLKVIYKKNTEEYFKAKGDYDFSRTMNSPAIDSTLRKDGLLGDYLPNMTPEVVIEDFVNFTQRAETKLIRDSVSVNYAQIFAELQDLSSRYSVAQTSKFEGLSKLLQRNVKDPFGDAMKLALNISKQGEFTLWHQANEFTDALGTSAWRGISKSFLDARGGKVSWEDANRQLEKFGVGATFTDEDAFLVAQRAPDRNIIKVALQKANMLVANGMLRLDFANSLLNVISTPILAASEVSALRNSMKQDPKLLAILDGVMSLEVPGTPLRVPSATRLMMNAVADYFPDKNGLLERFKGIGTVKGPTALYHDMMRDISLTPNLVPSKFAETVDRWVDKGARLTFSDQAEDFTRYVSSHMMWQITQPAVQAGRMTAQEQNAFISIFTNRVQGNYVASQRPVLFQGTLGGALGLFQTYQFNLFQQLFRHIENKDKRTIAIMGALQGTLFGLNGMPLFDAINTQLVGNASINDRHADAYSYAVQAAGKPIGDWLMYGTASAFPLFGDHAPALYTRGDLNPRSVFVLPTSPMDVPAVAASMKVISATLGVGKQIAGGADVSDALLHGLEHNGLNRPLAGLAQVFKGNVTTGKGDLISASSDWDTIATASRILGAKPMDESIARNEMYRSAVYKAVDKQRIDALGTIIKDKLRDNEPLTSEDWLQFQAAYASKGGRIEGFTQAVARWGDKANKSIINSLAEHNQTMAGRRMIEIMGGDPLQDYTNVPVEE